MKQLQNSEGKTAGEAIEKGMRICNSTSTVLWLVNLVLGIHLPFYFILIGAIVAYVGLYAGLTGIEILLKKLVQKWIIRLLHLGILTFELMTVLYQPHECQGLFAQSLILSILIASTSHLFFGILLYLIYSKEKYLLPGILFIISGAGLVLSLAFLEGEGRNTGWQKEWILGQIKWQNETSKKQCLTEREKASFLSTVKDGHMNTAMLTYGTGKKENLKAITVDLSPYVSGYSGLNRKIRDWEAGYTLEKTPLHGNIYYPQNEKNCPVLFFIHGQHLKWEESYQGYEYLGKYLASHGYVFVTIDENALNSGILEEVTQENDARAILLLENIKQVLSYNRNRDTPLYQKINPDKIVLAGHSRGGEAITDAALFSKQSHYPGNGNRLLPYRFSIKGLIAIAPTEGQYYPAGHEVALNDISYLLLQGGEDQDVNTYMGLQSYERISFYGKKTAFKSALFIGGANHGQFNTLWGRKDVQQPFSAGLNTAQMMSGSNQRKLLKYFTKIFLDVTLRGDTRFENLFSDYITYQDVLPHTVYSQQYQNNTYENIADFEEDSDLITGAGEGKFAGTTLLAENTTLWSEENYLTADNDAPQILHNHVLHLKWRKPQKEVEYTCKFEEYDATGKYLQFDISERKKLYGKSSEALQTAKVVFTDKNGNETILPLLAYAWIQSPFPIKSTKIQNLWDIPTYKYSMQTVRIPISDVQIKGGETVRLKKNTDVHHLVKVSLRFEKQTVGDIEVDKIGFSK